MASLFRQLWREAVLVVGWPHLVVPLVGIAALADLLAMPAGQRDAGTALRTMELLLPVTAGVLAADAPAREFVDGAVDWRLALPGGPLRLLAVRVMAALGLWAIFATAIAVPTWMLYLAPAAVVPAGTAAAFAEDVVALLLPPALFFGSLGVAGTLLVRNAAGGMTAALGFWAANWASRGRATGPFHVLAYQAPLPDLSYAASRWWLLAGAVMLMAGLAAFYRAGDRWLR